MDTAELKSRFRSEVQDENTPYLWSDIEVSAYANHAQTRFCQLVRGIADSSSSMTSLTTTVGLDFVTLDPLILKVRSARRADGTDIPILNFEDLQNGSFNPSPGRYGGTNGAYRLDSTTGPIKALVAGMERGKLRVLPLPDVATPFQLIVYRLPLAVIEPGDDAQELEIEERHHEILLEWMKYRAFRKADAETFDKGQSDEAKMTFDRYCAEARDEKNRLEHKYRTVAYGGY